MKSQIHDNNLGLFEFSIEGQFKGFISDITGKFKYLQLGTESGDIQIKIPKKLRLPLSLSLEPGEQIRVSGVSKSDLSTAEHFNGKNFSMSSHQAASTIKLKAHGVKRIGSGSIQNVSLQQPINIDLQVTPNSEISAYPKAKIIVCQKSGCLKRGGKGQLLELQKMLRDYGLQDRVTIDYSSRCLKCCKSAPNYILQIGNQEYKNIHPQAIASLLENY